MDRHLDLDADLNVDRGDLLDNIGGRHEVDDALVDAQPGRNAGGGGRRVSGITSMRGNDRQTQTSTDTRSTASSAQSTRGNGISARHGPGNLNQ